MKEVNKTDLTPEDFKDIPKRKNGPLTTKDKEDIIRNIREEITEKGRKQSKAIKETAAKYFRSISLIRSVVREFKACGDVIGGPYYRFRLSTFEKFDMATKDTLRGLVHDQMRDCKEKKEGARYPTVNSIHTAFHEYSNAHPELPKWGRSTTYHILQHLGFMNLANKDIHYGLLVDNEYTVKRRAYVCEQFKRLEEEGYHLVFLDESYINVGHNPRKHWHDTTLHTAKQAKDAGFTTGTIKPPGRGERLILIGAGSREGNENFEVIKRTEGKGNDIEYKKNINMDGPRFLKFVEDTVKKVKAKGHKKIAFVLDNASYHNEYRADIPRPGWAIDRIKDFCKLHDLEVFAVHGKKGKPVKQDYMDAVNIYVEQEDCKYKLDVLLESYGIKAIRLPPYHPGNFSFAMYALSYLRTYSGVPRLSFGCPSGVPWVSLGVPQASLGRPSGVPRVSLGRPLGVLRTSTGHPVG